MSDVAYSYDRPETRADRLARMAKPAQYLEEIKNLRAIVATLQSEIKGLKQIEPTPFGFPAAWQLTERHAQILHSLATGNKGYRSFATLYEAIDDGSDNLLKAHLSHLRKKLRPFGIEINTYRGQGLQLSPASLQKIRSAV